MAVSHSNGVFTSFSVQVFFVVGPGSQSQQWRFNFTSFSVQFVCVGPLVS